MRKSKFRIVKEIEIRRGEKPVAVRYLIEYKWWLFWFRYNHVFAKDEWRYGSGVHLKKVRYYFNTEEEAKAEIRKIQNLYRGTYFRSKIIEVFKRGRYGELTTVYVDLNSRFDDSDGYRYAYSFEELCQEIDRHSKPKISRSVLKD